MRVRTRACRRACVGDTIRMIKLTAKERSKVKDKKMVLLIEKIMTDIASKKETIPMDAQTVDEINQSTAALEFALKFLIDRGVDPLNVKHAPLLKFPGTSS